MEVGLLCLLRPLPVTCCWRFIHFRACNFKYIAIQWDKPRQYGNAHIKSYKLFINGVMHSDLSQQQTGYSFTSGTGCKEYAFQLQVHLSFNTTGMLCSQYKTQSRHSGKQILVARFFNSYKLDFFILLQILELLLYFVV